MARYDHGGGCACGLRKDCDCKPSKKTDVGNVPKGVVELFETLALNIARRGFKHYSADAILHRIRWHHEIDQGAGEFKVNNNWRKPLALSFMEAHPELPEFFEVREQHA